MRRDYSHPCIIAWVPFNESWGVPNLPDSQPERHYVRSLYHLTKTLDPTRPVIGNDGWESVATDIIGIHDYDADPERLGQRYQAEDVLPRLFERERPGGRLLVLELEEQRHAGMPVMLTEFGGIAASADRRNLGLLAGVGAAKSSPSATAPCMEQVNSARLLAGFCYTQFADTYQEANGLLHADRTPKFPLEEIAAATRGEAAAEAKRKSPIQAAGVGGAGTRHDPHAPPFEKD